MLCFWIPCYKLYKEGVFSYVFTLIKCAILGWTQKKLTLKVEHKIK
jgi:hypothetical protein